MYKRHDRFKQAMRETTEQVFMEKIKSLAEQTIQDLAVVPGVARPQSVNPKGHALRALHTITSLNPCELHIPLGIRGRTEEVAKALAIPGSSLFHGTPIPPNYSRVQVLSIEPKNAE
jgi:hypothetical protein